MQSLTTPSRSSDAPDGAAIETCRSEARGTQPPLADGLWRGAIGVLSLLMLLLFAAALQQGGYFARVAEYLTPRVDRYLHNAGISARKIVIKGQVNLRDAEVIAALGISAGQSLFGFDALEAQKRLSQLQLVRGARVMRLLPSTLLVEIEERVPFARWAHDERVDLIDRDGVVLDDIAHIDAAAYPLVAGAGAGAVAEPLIRLMSSHEELAESIGMARFTPVRRWDLVVRSGAVIKLPADDIALALARFLRLPGWRDLLQQADMVIDMRLPDRAFVRRAAPRQAANTSAG